MVQSCDLLSYPWFRFLFVSGQKPYDSRLRLRRAITQIEGSDWDTVRGANLDRNWALHSVGRPFSHLLFWQALHSCPSAPAVCRGTESSRREA